MSTAKPVTPEYMARLASKLFEWREAYYRGDGSPVSDATYDSIERLLASLEERYPHYKTYDSPIGKVGS